MDTSKMKNPMLGWKMRPVVEQVQGAKDLDDIKFNYMLMPKPDTPEHVAEWKKVLKEYADKKA
ncbi:hypothetical protein [Apilactobacillus bombintestini]|uniref:Uncharacterized protein n=1 Tax=Apilactobacillus bombintestini TaxID=2419772 RepID=A0A387ATS4_9LACO|nr:hypothetical protein [Apilactobacillus bombintestini]AYF93048.1 hypothetical protein D7I45_06030 [Apilactobacillus bombintestini]